MNPSFREEDIPMLTEVIEEVASPSPALDQAPVSATAASMTTNAAPAWTDADREALERRLQERILRQLQGRIDTVLEQQVRDVLADVLQMAVGQLADDIRTQLQVSMEGIVAQAVAQEVARLAQQGEPGQ